MVKVKICGITNLADAQTALAAGCDALGFVFFRRSPRYIAPGKARGIIRSLPRGTVTVGVFANARERTVRRIKKLAGLSMLQFHGKESAAFCRRFAGQKVIKAFRMRTAADAGKLPGYDTFAFLLDSYSKEAQGGTGKRFDWSLRATAGTAGKLFFLSGGLTAGNVRSAIACFRPQWVDVSTGVEVAPGKKDAGKVSKFIRAAKRM
jgi:phosphoribosylanthranilate isomerase